MNKLTGKQLLDYLEAQGATLGDLYELARAVGIDVVGMPEDIKGRKISDCRNKEPK
jgi:hypothetical protein